MGFHFPFELNILVVLYFTFYFTKGTSTREISTHTVLVNVGCATVLQWNLLLNKDTFRTSIFVLCMIERLFPSEVISYSVCIQENSRLVL